MDSDHYTVLYKGMLVNLLLYIYLVILMMAISMKYKMVRITKNVEPEIESKR